MDEEKKAAEETSVTTTEGKAVEAVNSSGGGVEASLLRIEELLKAQAKQNKKLLTSNHVRTIGIIAFVIVFALFAFFLYEEIVTLTQGLPDLIEQTDKLVVQAAGDLDAATKSIETIDFEGINTMVGDVGKAMEGVSKIDFGALNESIEGLAEGVKSFSSFVSNPFGIG